MALDPNQRDMMYAEEMNPNLRKKKPLGVATGERTEAGSTTDLGYGQAARDQAMLQKQYNVTTAQLRGLTNPNSAFNPGNRNFDPARGELILAREAQQQQLMTAQRAANPPRYEVNPMSSRATDARRNLVDQLESNLMMAARERQLGNQPGPVDPSAVQPQVEAFRQSIAPKPPDTQTLLAREAADNRFREAQALARSDQDQRISQREFGRDMTFAQRERMLAEEYAATRTAQAGATRAGAEATRAQTEAAYARADADISSVIIPAQAMRDKGEAIKASTPGWVDIVGGVASAIKSESGNAPSTLGSRMLQDGIQRLDALPPEAQALAAAEILSALEASSPGLSLDKQALESSPWRWLAKAAGVFGNGELARIGLAGLLGADEQQTTINELLKRMRGMRNQAAGMTTGVPG